MVTVEDLLFRQGQLETEVLCLQDAVQRLAHRIFVLESFIKQKHGQLALDETILFSPEPDEPEAGASSIIKEAEEVTNYIEDFSEFLVHDSSILGPHAQQYIITSDPVPKGSESQLTDEDTQNVPEIHIESKHHVEDAEIVPDAVREETVSVSGANVNLLGVGVYEGDLNLMGNDVEDAVIYDVIPTSMVSYDHTQADSLNDSTFHILPTNKYAGTIRIYKPELKSFTRLPSSLDSGKSASADAGHNSLEKHQCSVCQKEFLRFESMQRHLLLHSVLRFRCDECDRDFKNMHNLNLHKGKHQRLRERDESAKKAKQSSLAPAPLFEFEAIAAPPSEDTASVIRAQCPNNGSYFKCRHCDLAFTTKSRRVGHERTHRDDAKPYACEVCGLSFRSRSGLADHSIGHAGTRNHLCHICPAGFLRSRNLLKHIRFVHSLVQIKTVLEGKRVVEFVSPEQAEKLIEERKSNVESKESKAERLANFGRKRKIDEEPEHGEEEDEEEEGPSPSKRGRGRPRTRRRPEEMSEMSQSEEEDGRGGAPEDSSDNDELKAGNSASQNISNVT